MGTSWNRFFIAAAVFSLFFPFAVTATNAQENDMPDVRLILVQGDVRVSRGNDGTPDLNKPWEQAIPGLAIEEGFALATGSGRAEIEFENGSIAYLAENSLLLFTALEETAVGRMTHLALATGMATFSLNPASGEVFLLETATEVFEVRSPKKKLLRLESYLDGAALTPLEEKGVNLTGGAGLVKVHAEEGRTIFVGSAGPMNSGWETLSTLTDQWDQWVAARETEYRATLAKAMEASGVDSAFPGLTELYAHGEFFACGESEACWQPKLSRGASQAGQDPAAPPQTSPPQAQAAGEIPSDLVTEDSIEGDCFPLWVHRVKRRDAKGKLRTVSTTTSPASPTLPGWTPFACNAPAFQFQRNRYVPVFERRRHHHHHHDPHCPPVHWVKVHGAVGFVPTHPKDRPGTSPVNLAHGIILPPKGRAISFQEADTSIAGKPTVLIVLKDTPKEFRNDVAPIGARVAPPQIQAHFSNNLVLAGRFDQSNGQVPIISYDFKSRQFMASGLRNFSGSVSKPVAIGGLPSRGGFSGTSGSHGGDHGMNGASYSGGGRSSSSSGSAHSSSGSGYSGGGGRSSGSSSSSSSAGSASHSSGSGSSGSISPSSSASAGSGSAAGGRPH